MKRISWYRSLTFKFTASLTLSAVLVTMVAAAINIRMRSQDYIHDVGMWAYQLSETIKNATRHSMMVNRSHEIQLAVESIASQVWIEKVRIFDAQGTIAYSSNQSEIGRQLDTESRECMSCHQSDKTLTRLPKPEVPQIIQAEDGSGRVLSSVVAIPNEPDCANAACHVHPPGQKILGILDVIIPFDPFDQQISSGTTRLIWLSVISIFSICFLIGALARYQIVRPIQLLLEGTQRVAEGRFDHTLPVQSRDELGSLSKAFNRMTRELRSHDEDLKRWVVTLEDKVKERTQELEKARIRLVQQEKMASLGRLSAGVAHEINNPLTSILVFSTILRDKLDAGHADYRKVSTIVNETIRCREIVDRLLAFSRQDEPRKEKRQINQVINRSLELLKNQALFQNIRVDLRLSRDLPEVSIDVNQIQQVFVNILINAADAMPRGGDLAIRSYVASLPEGRVVVCEFSDTGRGIPEEDIPRLFDPFFSTKDKGTGLGLSICYGIIQRHGGKIEVRSKKDQGSLFTVQLPLG
jgi:two-component system, NtrC family, sensor kinase